MPLTAGGGAGNRKFPIVVGTKLLYFIGALIPQNTRSQAVARIADRTASQHILGSGDVIGHVTIDNQITNMPFPIGSPLEPNLLSLTVSEIFNVKCNAMVDMTLIRPLHKGQGHSLWYQSISHIRLPIGSQ